MNLIARYLPGKREPEYLVDRKTLEGKYATRCGDGLYGPFDTAEEAVAFEPTKVSE